MLLVMMRGHNSPHRSLRQAPQMPLQRTTHAGRTWINQQPIVDNCRKELSKKEGDHIARETAEKQDGELAPGKLDAPSERPNVGTALCQQVANSRAYDQRQP